MTYEKTLPIAMADPDKAFVWGGSHMVAPKSFDLFTPDFLRRSLSITKSG